MTPVMLLPDAMTRAAARCTTTRRVASHEENPFVCCRDGGAGHRIRGRPAAGADAGRTGQRRRLLHRHQPDPVPGGHQIRVPTVGNGTGNDNCQLGLGNDSVAISRLQIALNSLCNFSAGTRRASSSAAMLR
jgi:hypothetical protein